MALFAALEVTFSVSGEWRCSLRNKLRKDNQRQHQLWICGWQGQGMLCASDFCGDKPIRRWSEEQKLQLADAIWRKEYIVPPHCLLMNSSKENWRLGLIILAVKQSVK